MTLPSCHVSTGARAGVGAGGLPTFGGVGAGGFPGFGAGAGAGAGGEFAAGHSWGLGSSWRVRREAEHPSSMGMEDWGNAVGFTVPRKGGDTRGHLNEPS